MSPSASGASPWRRLRRQEAVLRAHRPDVHGQAAAVGVADQGRRCADRAVGVARQHERRVRPDAVGVLVDRRPSLSGVSIRRRPRASWTIGSRVRPASRRRIVASNDSRPTRAHGVVEAAGGRARAAAGRRAAGRSRRGGSACLSSSSSAHGATAAGRLRADHRQHLGQGRHALGTVVRRVGRAGARHPLARGEGLELGEGEVLRRTSPCWATPSTTRVRWRWASSGRVGDVGRAC